MILYIQILVGITQLLGGAIRLVSLKDLKSPYAQGLVMYWVLVFVYFLQLWLGSLLVSHESIIPESLAMIYILFIPWLIAAYYVQVVYFSRQADNMDAQV